MGCDHFSDNQGHIGDQQKDQTAKTRQIVCRPKLRKFPRVPKFHAIDSKITTLMPYDNFRSLVNGNEIFT